MNPDDYAQACYRALARACQILADLSDEFPRDDHPALADRTARIAVAVEHATAILCAQLPAAAVQELLEAETAPGVRWEHPAEILDRPLPDFVELLEACGRRLEEIRDDDTHRHLKNVTAKVGRAQRIDESARRRRGRRRPP